MIRPKLVYTRKYGWIVMRPVSKDNRKHPYHEGYSRPGNAAIESWDILAEADLPPPPDEAT